MDNPTTYAYWAIAYLIFWLIPFVFLGFLWKRLGRLEKRLESLGSSQKS